MQSEDRLHAEGDSRTVWSLAPRAMNEAPPPMHLKLRRPDDPDRNNAGPPRCSHGLMRDTRGCLWFTLLSSQLSADSPSTAYEAQSLSVEERSFLLKRGQNVRPSPIKSTAASNRKSADCLNQASAGTAKAIARPRKQTGTDER